MSQQPKWMAKVLERPYSVRTPKGDTLYLSDRAEAQTVSRVLRGVYSVFPIDARSWVPVGIIQ